MSTYWHLECPEHTPPIRSQEVTQHTKDRYYWEAVELVRSRPIPEISHSDYGGLQFRSNAKRFLVEHPACHVYLVSENEEYQEIDVSWEEMMQDRIKNAELSLLRLKQELAKGKTDG